MNDLPASGSTSPAENPRPVSLFTTVFVLALFAIFFFVVRYFYSPTRTAPQNTAPQNLTEDAAWRATSTSRRAALNELRQNHAKEASSYGWVDKDAGIVRLPIERAMELTVEHYGAKQPPRSRREVPTPRRPNL